MGSGYNGCTTPNIFGNYTGDPYGNAINNNIKMTSNENKDESERVSCSMVPETCREDQQNASLKLTGQPSNEASKCDRALPNSGEDMVSN